MDNDCIALYSTYIPVLNDLPARSLFIMGSHISGTMLLKLRYSVVYSLLGMDYSRRVLGKGSTV